MKYILTFDIGIKNLAYCLIRYDDINIKSCNIDKMDILYWGILDISHKSLICKCMTGKKVCNMSSQFYLKNAIIKSINLINKDKTEDNNYENSKLILNKEQKDIGYCRIHANILKKENKELYDKLQKTNKSPLYKDSFNLQIERLLNALENFYDKIINSPYHLETNIINNKIKLFNIDNLEIYIENQPVLKNPIMKTISISLYTFFYIKKINFPNKIRTINLISATVKTKPPFYNLLKKNINITTCLNTVNDYKNRKNFCINLASEIMNTKFNNSLFNIYAKSYFFLSKKKDDLADTLLYCFYAILNF